MEFDCLACIGERAMAIKDRDAGVLHNGEEPAIPVVEKAVTLAPQWVSQVAAGQMMMSCVAVPTCLRHLNVEKETPIQRATRSGLMLGGQSPQ